MRDFILATGAMLCAMAAAFILVMGCASTDHTIIRANDWGHNRTNTAWQLEHQR